MPKWVKRWKKDALVLLPEDIDRARALFQKAEELWRRGCRDEGSACLGAGIAVLWLPPRCRKPQVKIVIPSPVQGDGSRSVHIPINYLCRNGIAAFLEYGRAD